MKLLTIVNFILLTILFTSIASASLGYSNPNRPKLTAQTVAANICVDNTFLKLIGGTLTGDLYLNNGLWMASTTDTSSQTWFRYTNVSDVYAFYYSIPKGTNVFDQNVSITKSLNVSGTFTANTIKSNSGQANKVVCWKADGKTLGYCSDAPIENGECTCN